MRRLVILLVIVSVPLSVTIAEDRQQTAQKVLNDLYRSNGNHVYLKPRIKITEDQENAALYLRRSNKIELSQRMYDVCTKFGKDSLSALAFVLGHELAHAFQEDYEVSSTSFLAYDKMHEDGTHHEESADVLGIFMAFLAGYDTRPILKELIATIYQEYQLNPELKGYPTLKERQNSIIKVKEMSSSLINIYEGAAFLVSIGQYRLAAESYGYIEKWFKGKEIYNNLGVCKIMEALNIKDQNLFPYVLPFEIDWDTRMSKPFVSRGLDALTPKEKKLFDGLVDEAIEYFSLASKMDPTEVGSEINIVCAMTLQGKAIEAVEYGETLNLELRSYLKRSNVNYSARYLSALAIAYCMSQKKSEAKRIWKEIIEENPGSQEAKCATINLEIVNKTKSENKIVKNCSNINFGGKPVDGVRLHRPAPEGEWVTLDDMGAYAICIDNKDNSSVYTYRTEEGYFTLQRILDLNLIQVKDPAKMRASVLTSTGYISGCKTQKIVLRHTSSGELKEWVRYY